MFKIFGSHFSPEKGLWAFGYRSEEAVQLWDQIPLDCDIVVTHTPPRNHCDETLEHSRRGCEALRSALWRVRPLLAVCGHVHEGRGAELIEWDLENQFEELELKVWTDTGNGNKTFSFVDLSSSVPKQPREHHGLRIEDGAIAGSSRDSLGTLQIASTTLECKEGPGHTAGIKPAQTISDDAISSTNQLRSLLGGLDLAQCASDLETTNPHTKPTRADPARSETVVINAAIMASSWPHGSGGKKFNKPIVIDIDLPISTSIFLKPKSQ